MIHSLRTRLFATVGIVLAAAIALSGLLSRRATLIEVRAIATRPHASDVAGLREVGERVEAHLAANAGAGVSGLDDLLRGAEQEMGRALLLAGGPGTVMAASNARFAAGRVRQASAEGDLSLDFQLDGQTSTLELRRAPVYVVPDAGGRPLAYLFLLPADVPPSPERAHAPPPWMLATASIGLAALVLTFAFSRRILGPVSALRAAAERMTRGDLDARVEVRGSDELADLSRAFNTMAGQLAETERLRRQLVSDVAHELRSPVTNLRCTLEAIQDGLVEANRHSVDDLHEETLFLQRMIADLEDLALADAGGLVIHRESVDLAAVLQRAVATAGAHGTGGRITVEGGSTPVVVTGDRDRLEQVFRNLLLNARTHTAPDGSITVKVVSDADVVAVAVHDDGRGIRPDDLPHVFDRFYRADRSRTRATGGAGLGLAIARQLVIAHGGAIAAASDGEGRGATFTVRLPRAPW